MSRQRPTSGDDEDAARIGHRPAGVVCAACGERFPAERVRPGEAVRCGRCSAEVVVDPAVVVERRRVRRTGVAPLLDARGAVPTPAALCGACGNSFPAGSAAAGDALTCPRCRNPVQVIGSPVLLTAAMEREGRPRIRMRHVAAFCGFLLLLLAMLAAARGYEFIDWFQRTRP